MHLEILKPQSPPSPVTLVMTFLGPRDRPIFNRDLRTVDQRWSSFFNKRRIDRNPTYIAVNFGLVIASLSLLSQGPIHPSPLMEVSPLSRSLLSMSWGMGGLIALIGSLSGTRFIMPHMPRRQSYLFGIASCPAIFSGLFYYAFLYARDVDHAVSSFATSLGFLIAVASIVNMIFFALEIRRINNNIALVKKYIHRG